MPKTDVPPTVDRVSNIQELSDTVEKQKAAKKQKRQQKQKAAAAKKRRQVLERLVAPGLLVLTIVISWLIMVFAQ